MTSWLQNLLLLEIVLIPSTVAVGNLGFEFVKIVVFYLFTIVELIIWHLGLGRGEFELKISAIKKTALLFIALLLLTSILGIHPAKSLIGAFPYFQGGIFYIFLLTFSLMVSSAKLPLIKVAYSVTGVSLVVAVIAIIQFLLVNILGVNIATYSGRVISTFGQPNFYAGFLLLSLPFVYQLREKLTFKKSLTIYLILGLAIIISFSRSSIFLMLGLVVTWLLSKLNNLKKVITIGFVVAVLLMSLFISFKTSAGLIWFELGDTTTLGWQNHYSPEKRIYIWPVIYSLIQKNPVLGYGLDSLEDIFPTALWIEGSKSPVTADLKNLIVDRSHNYILDLLFFSGVLGLASWIILNFLLFKKAKGVLLTFLILYLIWSLFQNQSIVQLLLFWLTVGLIDEP